MEDRLLTQRRKLVVAKSVCTDLITTAHCSITTAHPGKNKSKQLIKEQYYWQSIDNKNHSTGELKVVSVDNEYHSTDKIKAQY